jgi:DNA repair exonuclease SbcCD ATPase subunit
MSLTRLEVRNFQSLRKVDLDLGLFTVIVGPSSSGKSALMRAFRALASNVRGSGVITRGQKAMAITARTETHTVTLERTDRSGAYRISDGGSDLTFTKLAGEVPEHVTTALRIDPVTERGSVNFAGQFDKPYLLDESGAAVARELGELTNVTQIFEAVRTANRVRASAASTLKTRRSDLDAVKEALGGFQGLTERVRLLEQAEKLDAERQALQARAGRLGTAITTLRITQRAIEKADVPEVPSTGTLDATLDRFLDLQGKLRGVATKARTVHDLDDEYQSYADDLQRYTETLADMLTTAQVCPTCGQSIREPA